MSFHRQRVRTSSLLSEGFILPMVSSHSFGSYVCDKNALLGLGFPMSAPDFVGVKQTANVNSLTHSSIGTTSPRLTAGPVCLLANGFSFYFTPISGFFSPFPHG